MAQCERDKWIRNVASKDGPESPTTRLVLLVLASRMDKGGHCYPGTDRLAVESGLSKRAVLTHLATAEGDGWIRREVCGTGRGWKRHGYHIALPGRLQSEGRGGEAPAPRQPRRGEPDDTDAVNVVHPNLKENLSDKDTDGSSQDERRRRDAYPDSFQRAWAAYPKRAGGNPKKTAYRCWRARVREGASEDELERGVARYAAYCDAIGKTDTEYVKQASTFLGPDEHWREDWAVPPKSGRAPEPPLADLQALP